MTKIDFSIYISQTHETHLTNTRSIYPPNPNPLPALSAKKPGAAKIRGDVATGCEEVAGNLDYPVFYVTLHRYSLTSNGSSLLQVPD